MHVANEDGDVRDSRPEAHSESTPIPRSEEHFVDPIAHFQSDRFAQGQGHLELANSSIEDPQIDPTHSSSYGYNLESSSSSFSSQHSGAIFAEDDESGDDDGQYQRNGSASSRSSISSLPGSVVVYPPGKVTGLPFVGHQNDPSNMPVSNHAGGRKKGKPPKYGSRMRDRSSPFRHPSSVLAMQMGDDGWDGSEGGFDTLTPSSKKSWARDKSFMQSPSFSEMSTGSRRSGKSSGYSNHRSSTRTASPQIQQHQQHSQEQTKEYPLVLLHCTLLPPSLGLPRGLGTPSPQLLKEVLPLEYWQRWKLLEDKVVGSGLLRDRGVLISHPQEAYELLEERLLESLELVKPRVAYGHFLGRDEDSDGGREEEDYATKDGSRSVCDDGNEHTCADCGKPIEASERKWDVKVYAANGLMRAGAWAAAWREMEKVDVEVSIWLPTEVKQDLERRIAEEDAVKIESERRMAEDEERWREVYGDSAEPPPEDIDGLINGEYDQQHSPDKQHDTGHSLYGEPRETTQNQPGSREIDLRLALSNYFRILANEPRNAALFFLSLLVLFLAMNPASPGVSTGPTAQGAPPAQSSLSPTLEHHSPSISRGVVPTSAALSSQAAVDPQWSSSPAAPSSLSSAPHEAAPVEQSSSNRAAESPEVSLPEDSTTSPKDIFKTFSYTKAAEYEDDAATSASVLADASEVAEPPAHSEET